MARLSSLQSRVRRKVADLSLLHLSVGDLGEALLDTLALVFPADRATLFGIDPASLLINRVLASLPADPMMLGFWLRHIYLVNEASFDLTLPGMMRYDVRAAVHRESVETSWGWPRRLYGEMSSRDYAAFWDELQAPPGGILRGVFGSDRHWIAAFDAIRLDAGSGFRNADVAFLRLLGPAIASGIRAAMLREQVASSLDVAAPDSPGVLLLGSGNQPRYMNVEAETWLSLLADMAEPRAPGVTSLPVGILAANARLQAKGAPLASSRLWIDSPLGKVRVDATRSASGTGETAVILTPEARPALPPLPLEWVVTPAERSVIEQLIRGNANRQIASNLSVSEKTIETHLMHIYEKLGVHSRAELLSRYFRSVYLPSVGSAFDDLPA